MKRWRRGLPRYVHWEGKPRSELAVQVSTSSDGAKIYLTKTKGWGKNKIIPGKGDSEFWMVVVQNECASSYAVVFT